MGRGGILCRDNLVFLFVGLFKVGLGVLMWLVSGFSCGYGVCSVCCVYGGVKGILVAMAGLTAGCLVNRSIWMICIHVWAVTIKQHHIQ